MKWSWTVGRFFGVDLKIHVTFLLILFWGAFHWRDYGLGGAAFGAGLMLLLFLCVALHEFGHAIAAQYFGIPVREIIMLPIGGMAVLGRNPSRPLHELVIAAAGPIVNVVIAAALAVVLAVKIGITGIDLQTLVRQTSRGPSLATLLVWLLNANIVLVLFNMLPAFPMDGGRIFRGVLGLFLPWSRATRIAAGTGQVLAIAMGLWALSNGLLLLLAIAVMIFLAAGQTSAAESARTMLSTERVGDAYNKYALVLNENDRVSRVIDYLLTSYQPDFAVLRGRELLGIVQRQDVLRALAEQPVDLPVTRIMISSYARVPAEMPLDAVREQMEESQSRIAAVWDGERFLGLVSAEDIAEAYAVLSFHRRPPAASASALPDPPADPAARQWRPVP